MRVSLLCWRQWALPFYVCRYWAATRQNQQNDCAPSEDSDQNVHPLSLIGVFAVRIKKTWVRSYRLSASEDSNQTGGMPRLIWVVAGRTVTLLVLSFRGLVYVCRFIYIGVSLNCGFILCHTFLRSPIYLVLVWFLLYGPSTHFRSFRARSVTLTTLFLSKPPR